MGGGPGTRRGVERGGVRAVDVAPTLIDLVDSEKLNGRHFDGISLKEKLEVRRQEIEDRMYPECGDYVGFGRSKYVKMGKM